MTPVFLNRAEFLRLAALGSAGCLLRPRDVVAQDAMDGRISSAIAAYDDQGVHRTATPTDDRSAEWLADLADRAGARAALETFPLDRIDVADAHLEVNGRQVPGLPMFDGAFTDPRGISGRLGLAGSATPVALVVSTANGVSRGGASLAEMRRSGTHRAIVVVTEGQPPGLCPINSDSFAAPFGPPVLMVAADERERLQDAARAGRDVRVVARVRRAPARASNVVATLEGGRAGAPPLVVMTPRSGWWHCASERGGGLACWLEIMRAAAARGGRPYLFVASSGHELGHLGLDAFIDARPGLIKSAAAWIHLGANIGAEGGQVRLQTSDDDIETQASAALAGAGAGIRQRIPRGTVPAGEARNIHVGGGRYLSLLGSNPLFHNPADRWPGAVDVPAVARYARGLIALTEQLA
jgi:hypothetical protein